MADLLSIPNLLSLLEVDRQAGVMKLCAEAEGLRRRRRYPEAIQLAEKALGLARNDFNLMGTALLYASCARLSSKLPGQDRRAARDCSRAIRLLDLEPYNHAVAKLIRAQIETKMIDAQAALEYYLQAATTLKDVIREARERNRKAAANQYLELQNKVNTRIDQISGAVVHAEPIIIPAKLAASAEKKPAQVPLPIPTTLVWPAPEPIQIEFSPSGNLAFDLDVTRLIINNLHYNVQPVFPTPGGHNTLRLHPRQRYLALQVARKEDGFVLVRQQDRLDNAENDQIV